MITKKCAERAGPPRWSPPLPHLPEDNQCFFQIVAFQCLQRSPVISRRLEIVNYLKSPLCANGDYGCVRVTSDSRRLCFILTVGMSLWLAACGRVHASALQVISDVDYRSRDFDVISGGGCVLEPDDCQGEITMKENALAAITVHRLWLTCGFS